MCLCMDNVWLDLIERRNKKEEGGRKRRIAVQITLIKRLLFLYGAGLLLKEIRNDYQKKKKRKGNTRCISSAVYEFSEVCFEQFFCILIVSLLLCGGSRHTNQRRWGKQKGLSFFFSS